jgi:hypothetical protein
MGLAESTLKIKTLRPIVRPDSIARLPSFAVDSCIFTDNSVGFLITAVDLAKNTASFPIPIKGVISPVENTLIYLGQDDTIFTFIKDRLSGRVYCSISRVSNGASVMRECLATYEPLENEDIDRLASLFSKVVSQTVSVAV